jgi:hypothetical protein
LFALSPAVPAAGGPVAFSGEVDFFGPKFDRPFVAGFDLGPSNRDVGYESQLFYTRAAAEIGFVTETLLPSSNDIWDGAALIYANAFDPQMPEAGLLGYEGVGGATFASTSIQLTLEADRQYVFVQAGVTSIDFGRYDGTVTGGDVVFGRIPEPTIGVITCAVGGLLLRRRQLR